MTRLTILGVPIDPLTTQQVLARVGENLQKNQKCAVATVNSEFIVRAQHDQQFKNVLSRTSLNLPDGIGILWAATFLSQKIVMQKALPRFLACLLKAFFCGLKTLTSTRYRFSIIPDRVTGVDLSYHLSRLADKQGYRLFLLGDELAIATQAAAKLQQLFPHLQLAGTYSGDGSPAGDAQTRQQLLQHPADILLVAFGAPKQEYWIDRNLATVPATLAMGVGGTFRYLSGVAKRAPAIWQRLGLEWLYRLLAQPWRLKRQLALPRFVWLVILDKYHAQPG